MPPSHALKRVLCGRSAKGEGRIIDGTLTFSRGRRGLIRRQRIITVFVAERVFDIEERDEAKSSSTVGKIGQPALRGK
ncbi:hypothetical protein CCP2SC5_130015 [Azospirillaceae bacterium]